MKDKNLGIKSLVFIISGICLLWSFGFYFTRCDNENLIPLGEIMFYFPAVVMLFCVLIFYFRELIRMLNSRRKKRYDVTSNLVVIVFIILILFFVLVPCICGIKDLLNGPNEILMHSVQMVKKNTGGKYSQTNYYLEGVTSNLKSKKLLFRFYHQSEDEVAKLLDKDFELKIYYFETLNLAYRVEIYE